MRANDTSAAESQDRESPGSQRTDTSAWQWGVAALGFLLVCATLGLLLYEAFAGDRSPPDIVVEAVRITPRATGYLVEFRAENHGGSTASAVTVDAVLDGGGSAEQSHVTLDFVPSHSSRGGGLMFRSDPRAARLTLRATGYQRP